MTWMHGSYCSPPPEQERKLLLVAFLRSLPAFQTSAAAQWRLAAATDHCLLVLHAFTTVPKVYYMHPESIIVYINHQKSKATRHACLFLSPPCKCVVWNASLDYNSASARIHQLYLENDRFTLTTLRSHRTTFLSSEES